MTEKTDRRANPVALENIESWTGRFIITETEFQGDGVAFNAGDILFGKLRPYLAKVYQADSPGEAVGDFLVLRPNASIVSHFSQYQMLNRDFIDIVDGSTFGSKMPRASWEFVGGLKLSLPPLDEQTAIAGFLDRETAKIDALVAEQQRLVELLKEKRQAVISHAVTKGLNPAAPMKPSGIAWLGDIPSHWAVKPLQFLTDPKRQIMYGIVLPGPDVGDGIPVLKGGNVKPSRMNLDSMARTTPEIEAPYARARLKTGDLVYAIRGTIGDCEIVPAEMEGSNITQDVARVAIHGDNCLRWARWALLSSAVREELACGSLGAAVRGVNIYDLKKVLIPTPPVEEQKQISFYLDAETAKFDVLTAEAQRAIELLQERRSALISAAVTGKIDVRNIKVKETA
ncbi:restriction endonuclease subunit S [Myxococcota bacterium]|nr:restriction endonuclease subunit S [Myxococcota bacterium]